MPRNELHLILSIAIACLESSSVAALRPETYERTYLSADGSVREVVDLPELAHDLATGLEDVEAQHYAAARECELAMVGV